MDMSLDRYSMFPLWASETYHLLPADHSIIADRLSGSLTLVNWNARQFVTSCGFSDAQFPLVLSLLQHWPKYVPYQTLLILLDDELQDQENEEAELARLAEKFELIRVSRQSGESEEQKALVRQTRQEIEPLLQLVREALKDCQLCFHEVGLSTQAILDSGYMLMRPAPVKQLKASVATTRLVRSK